jgi:GLPGLI family protein
MVSKNVLKQKNTSKMKLRKISILSLIALIASTTAIAQHKFILSGKVEYEKKVNMYKKMGTGFFADEMKSKLPQFRTSYFDLYFNQQASIYKPGQEVEDKYKNFWGTASDEIIYNNFDSLKTNTYKQVFEQTYLLQDSLIQLEWKITNETRTIAGYECKKAVGRFMDTIYVIAFYSEEILVPAGPEWCTGLPGLILGLALPRLNTTWFATKLELMQPTTKDFAIPTKGKKTNRKEMYKTILNATKDWGADAYKEFLEIVL